MLFRNVENPRTRRAIAMMCLAAGLVIPYFVHPSTPLGLDLLHGVCGLLIGISLALSLSSLKLDSGRTKVIAPVLISIGMLCLAIAVASLKFLQPSAHFPPDSVDWIRGLLFGVSIGMTLLGVTLTALQRAARTC